MPDTLEADQKPWEIYAQKKPWELDWTAPPSDAVPSQEEQAKIRRLPRPEELTTYGGPPKHLASLAETLVEPSEEALSPRITTPKLPIKEGENKLLTIGKEAVNILSGIPEFISSPLGVVSTVVAPGAPVAVGTVFTAAMLKDLADQIQSNYKDWDKMSGTQKTKAITDMVGTGTFAAMPWLKPAISALRGKPTTSEVKSAEAIRSDEGQVPPPRTEPEVSQEKGGEDIQQPAPGPPAAPAPSQISLNPGDRVDYYSPVTLKNHTGVVTETHYIGDQKWVGIVNEDGAPVVQKIENVKPQAPKPTATETTPPATEEVPKVSESPPTPEVTTTGAKTGGKIYEETATKPDIVSAIPARKEFSDPELRRAQETVSKQTEAQYYSDENPIHERTTELIHKLVKEEAGTDDPAEVVDFYAKKFGISTPISFKWDEPGVKHGDIMVKYNTETKQPIEFVIRLPRFSANSRTSVQFLSTIRHEIEHAVDIEKRGYDFLKRDPSNRALTISRPQKGETVIQSIRRHSKGHHSEYEHFELDFLRKELRSQPPTELSGPGTPSAAQPPDPKAAIEALEESFRNIKGPRPTLEEQVKKAFNVGEKAARAKDAVSSAIQGLKSSGDYLIKKWEGIPNIDDMLRAKGELSKEVEKRGWRVRATVKTILRAMPTERQRAAILKWVDAGGDAEELRRGAAETKPQFRQSYEDALKLKGDELVAGQNIRNYFDERLDDAINAGVLQEGVENYIRRLYERDPKAQKQALAYVQSGILQQNPGLVKKRVFQFDWEAEKAGYRPVQDFLPRVATYEAELTRAIAAREFVRKMVGFEEEGKRFPGMKAPDGRPVVDVAGLGVPVEDAAGVREATLIKPSFKPGDETDPKNNRRDYVERDYPALRKWRWTTLDAGGKPIYVQGNLLIHPDFAGRIDALLEPSRVKYGRYPKLGRGALGLSSTVKQTMLDLSGFHQVQITVHGMEHKVMPWKIVSDIDFQNPNMDGLLKGGLTLGGEYYSAHHGEGLVGSALTRHIPILGPLMESYHNWLFQSYIPRIKTTMALAALERNRARYKGQLTEEQIYTKTANEANSAFGELNYIMLERSKTTQDIARLIMLAPDFLEARGRFAGGALEKGGKLGGHEQRAALLLGALTMYVTARIMNKLTDDKYHFEPENAFSLVHDGHAYSLRTVQGDILHLLEKPLQFWMNRLNPVFGRTALEIATGRDTFGRKRTVPEALWDTVKNTVPIALRSSQERKLWESMMNSMGVTARRWNDVDKAFTLAKDWKKQHGVTEPGEFIYDAEKDPLRGLKIALSRSDDAGAAQEIKKVLASKVYTREKLNAYFDRYAKMPFTGSAANDKKWIATLTDDQKKIVEGARQHKLALRNMYRQSRAKFDDLMRTPIQ